MRKDRFYMVPAVVMILRRENDVFLILRQNTGYRDGFYVLPSGHKEEGETALQAAIREAKEETGVDIDPRDVRFTHVMHRRETDERVFFYFEADKWQGEPYNAEPEKGVEAGWFPIDNLPENTIDFVLHGLHHTHHGEPYSEYGFALADAR